MQPLNTYATVVLDLLLERPRHPYELARVIAERHIDDMLQLKRGSLYGTVERLARDGLVEAVETSREGRRPERTVYRVTPAGRDAFDDRVSDMLGRAEDQPRAFTAALMLMNALPPERAERLLLRRTVQLRSRIAGWESTEAAYPDVPRAYLLEAEYEHVLARAELEWVERVIADLRSGELTWTPSTGDASHEEDSP